MAADAPRPRPALPTVEQEPLSLFNGFRTLLWKEVLRFWKVSFQTVAAPVMVSILYLLIFSHALSGRVDIYPGVSYIAFLVPGLVMMSVLQNAFANSSSSIIQSKITGNIIFILLPPIHPVAFYSAYVLGAIVRGMVVGSGVFIVTVLFVQPQIEHPLWILVFALLGSGILGTMGLIGGIWAEKIDQVAAFNNFMIMPLTFLSGVFYSVHTLPPFWLGVSHVNPFFYMVDGFRYGFFGQSDVNPFLSLLVVTLAYLLVALVALRILRSGYRLRT